MRFSRLILFHTSPRKRGMASPAGRCLAFSLPTAAGFHAARGIEGELELYWQTFTKKTGTKFGWQDYIDDLQKVIDAKAPPLPEQRTIRTLEVIKDYDRNPVMHPRDVVLNDMDARSCSAQPRVSCSQWLRKSGTRRKNLRLSPPLARLMCRWEGAVADKETDALAEAKRIMGNLARTPHKPHAQPKKKGARRPSGALGKSVLTEELF